MAKISLRHVREWGIVLKTRPVKELKKGVVLDFLVRPGGRTDDVINKIII
jgi:hypothetical protein